MQAGDFHRQQVKTGRYARPALRHNLTRAGSGKQRQILGTQLCRRLEAAVSFEIVLEAAIARTGDMSAHRVDGFIFAAKTIRATRVDQAQFGGIQVGQQPDSIDLTGERVFLRLEALWRTADRIRIQRAPFGLPQREATIKESHLVVAQPTQQPPQTASDHPGSIVVNHDLGIVIDTGGRQPGNHRLSIRQWMTSIRSGQRARKVAVQMQENGTRNMRFSISTLTVRDIGKLMAKINDAPARITQMLLQRGTINQCRVGHGRV